MRLRFWICTKVCLLGAFSASAWAQSAPLTAPTEKVVLTVTGNISKHNASHQAVFDLKMIEALPQHSFTTRTPWYNTPVKFTGPKLSDVLAAVGAQGKEIQAVALNDYRITIPVSDIQRYPVVMAWKINDQPIPIRAKGPLFVAYPYDSDAALHTAQFYERSIWQLKQLHIQ